MAFAQPGEQIVDAIQAPGPVTGVASLCGYDQVFPHREGRKDPTALRYQADSETGDALRVKACDRFAIQADVAFPWAQKTDDGRDAGGLAGAVASEQGQHASGPQGKANAMQDMAVTIIRMDLSQSERVRCQDTPPAFVHRQSRHRARHPRSPGHN